VVLYNIRLSYLTAATHSNKLSSNLRVVDSISKTRKNLSNYHLKILNTFYCDNAI